MEPIRSDWVGQRPLGQRSGRPSADPSAFSNALEPALVDGPGEDGRGPESPDRDRDRMEHASTPPLAAVESPPQAPRAPKAPPSEEAISHSPSGSTDRAPSPPAADPFFGPQPAANRPLDGLDGHGPLAPNPISLAENHARGLQPHNPPRPPLPAPQTATPDGPERSWTPLVPDRRQDGPVESRNTFTPLSPGRVAGPPPPPAVAAPPVPAPAPTDAEPPAREPVLQPLARRWARLVFTAAADRGGPPARAGRLRSPQVETPRVEPRQAEPAPASAPAGPDASVAPEAASAPKPVDPAEVLTAGPAADRPAASAPREAARLAAPPPRDEPLPPTSLLAHTRVRLDSELSVDLSTSGHKVDVALHGTPNAIEPLRALGAELGTSLASSGFSLGRFLAHDHEPEPGQDGEPAETESIDRPRTARRLDNSRIRRYA